MIDDSRKKLLIQQAKELAKQLDRFRTPENGDPVDPSRLAEVFRFVKASGTEDLPEFLKLLPKSYLKHASGSAAPQLTKIQQQVTPLLKEVSDAEELAYVLGWARRCMTAAEKSGAYSDTEDRGRRR